MRKIRKSDEWLLNLMWVFGIFIRVFDIHLMY